MKTKYDEALREDRQKILSRVLDYVPHDGWTEKSLLKAIQDSGIEREELYRIFPSGVTDIIEFWSVEIDKEMVSALEKIDLKELRVRERIFTAVKCRLMALESDKESLRRAFLHLGQPDNMILGMKCLYRTVDEIWFVSGDVSTDFNFYTKRGLLAAVYSSTVLFWLDDKSDDNQETWSFLERRINDALRIPKVTSKLNDLSSHVPNPRRLISRIREQLLESRSP
ncbi:MAG: COQ9 family protein [Alphaproteobacteria bacterium]|jgi:ubiquinone biosynthesis protein COQ9|nr:COQ9 family protein [Alphaproteobacteria bacterium]PPR14637.1 MAG: hypothetical protein CFH42_00396 [Alphaproteobacteria bacterium MarineAlpha12_Bin1]|tara:strand:+ start:10962 stop:11636 length:675 start_codon:yes stop_codon:yes gene_type:complete